MSKTFVISDTHFNHGNILEFKNYLGEATRTFESIDQMNEAMMDNWVSVVGPNDTVIHCGDVLFGHHKSEWMEHNFAKLPGKKRLVLGNHDNIKHIGQFFKDVQLWIDIPGFIFTHTPLHPSTLAEKHRFKEDKINVHGHIHRNPSPDGPYFCACVEQINYTPLNIEEIAIHQ